MSLPPPSTRVGRLNDLMYSTHSAWPLRDRLKQPNLQIDQSINTYIITSRPIRARARNSEKDRDRGKNCDMVC